MREPDTSVRSPGDETAIPFELIELLFFAYRDFISDPDRILTDLGFGRAHHRVLHFVNRHPGVCVADLLHILKITKQSLSRVLKQLIVQGYIEQRRGARDKRKRHLYVSTRGRALALRLARLQAERINRAIRDFSDDDVAVVREFLTAIIRRDERDGVMASIRQT